MIGVSTIAGQVSGTLSRWVKVESNPGPPRQQPRQDQVTLSAEARHGSAVHRPAGQPLSPARSGLTGSGRAVTGARDWMQRTRSDGLQVPGLARVEGGLRRLGAGATRTIGNFGGFLARNLTGSPEAATRVRAGADRIANLLDPQPPGPTSRGPARPDAAAAQRRADGIPVELDNHDYGPPASPSRRADIARDIDPATGRPRTGTLFVRDEGDGHRYATRNALPAGLSREQALEVFNRFNAPTREAIYGNGNDPRAREGSVDPTVVAGGPGSVLGSLAGRLPVGRLGGDVTMRRGVTSEGQPWAINSTIRDRHPLVGHITRTLEEHNGVYYIRTEGTGRGDDGVAGIRHGFNNIVGPRSFNTLDSRAAAAAGRLMRGETLG